MIISQDGFRCQWADYKPIWISIQFKPEPALKTDAVITIYIFPKFQQKLANHKQDGRYHVIEIIHCPDFRRIEQSGKSRQEARSTIQKIR